MSARELTPDRFDFTPYDFAASPAGPNSLPLFDPRAVFAAVQFPVIAGAQVPFLPPLAPGIDWGGDLLAIFRSVDLDGKLKHLYERIVGWIWPRIGGVLRFVFSGVQDAVAWLSTLIDSVRVKVGDVVAGWVGDLWRQLVGVWDGVRDISGGAFGWLRDKLRGFFGDIIRWASAVGQWVFDRLTGAWDLVSDNVGGAFGWLRDKLRGFFGDIIRWTSSVGQWLLDRLTGAWDLVSDNVGGAFGWLRAKVTTLIGDAVTGFRWLLGTLRNDLVGVGDFLHDQVGGAFGWLWDKTQTLLGGAQDVVFGALRGAFEWFVDRFIGPIVDTVQAKLAIPGKLLRGEYGSLEEIVDDLLDPPLDVLRSIAGVFLYSNLVVLGSAMSILPVLQVFAQPNVQRAMRSVHPTQLSPTVLMDGVNRDAVDFGFMMDSLARQGYGPAESAVFERLRHQLPGPSDLVTMVVREAFDRGQAELLGFVTPTPPDFVLAMQHQGLDPEWSDRYWWSHWRLPSVEQGMEMLHRREIGLDRLRGLLKALDLPPLWHESFINIAYAPLTRVDVRRMHKLGVLGDEQVLNAYMDLGYNEENARRLLEFTRRFNAPEDRSEIEDRRDAMADVIRKSYRRRLIDRGQAHAHMVAAGFAGDDAEFWLSVDDLFLALNPAVDADVDVRELTVPMVLAAYREGIWDRPRAQGELEALGFLPAAADLLLSVEDHRRLNEIVDLQVAVVHEEYLANAITRDAANAALEAIGVEPPRRFLTIVRWDLEKARKTRRLTPTQIVNAWQRGFFDDGQVRDELSASGYNSRDAEVLIALG